MNNQGGQSIQLVGHDQLNVISMEMIRNARKRLNDEREQQGTQEWTLWNPKVKQAVYQEKFLTLEEEVLSDK